MPGSQINCPDAKHRSIKTFERNNQHLLERLDELNLNWEIILKTSPSGSVHARLYIDGVRVHPVCLRKLFNSEQRSTQRYWRLVISQEAQSIADFLVASCEHGHRWRFFIIPLSIYGT